MRILFSKLIPTPLKKLRRKVLINIEKKKEQRLVSLQHYRYEKTLDSIRNKKGPVHIVFFAIYKSVWKYDSFYQLVKKDPRFQLSVLICPAVNRGEKHMKESLNECFEDFQKRGYNVIKGYDEKTNTYVNPLTLKPDIIFYTSPYDGLVDPRYYITNFLDIPSVYVNYGFSITNQPWGNGLLFHNLLWKQFIESDGIKKFILSIPGRNQNNMVISGYPPYDDYQNTGFSESVWKNCDKKIKRIIWAPHHTIETVDTTTFIQFSTFLKYSEFFRQLALDYKEKVQFVFKPHPLLKTKLYEHPEWGTDRTNEYYEWWEKGETTNYVSGEYKDLFLSSDAMIHDCGSFTLEYLYTLKPVMYLSDFNHESQINEVALKAHLSHYLSYSAKDIRDFIENVVLGENDPKKQERYQFFKEELLPPNGKTVAENMRDEILDSIYGSH